MPSYVRAGIRKCARIRALSPTQAHYYRVQARKLDELKTMADGLNAACRIQREAGGDPARDMAGRPPRDA